MRDKELWKYILGITGALLCIGCFVYFFAYEKEADIVVTERWWHFDRRMRYKERHCTTTVDSEGWISTSCSFDYYTRCKNTTIGQEWPPIAPGLDCTAADGDWVDDSITYRIKYRVSDTVETGQTYVNDYEWDQYAPGQRGRVTLWSWGGIKYFEPRGE